MPDLPRAVPTTYDALGEAIDKAHFPDERYWIDFKQQLYPTPGAAGKNTQGERQKAHGTLAANMASMANRGGFLVLGVAEDKSTTPPTFSPHPMPLPAGLKDDIDRVARDRITPPLYVETTAVEDPASPGAGFVVIEIPESDLAPHMVAGTYYGRSDSGKVTLSDDDVERLMFQRAQRGQRIEPEMAKTALADPIGQGDRAVPHGYFTAVPFHGWPDMFAAYTKDRGALRDLNQFCSQSAVRLANSSLQRQYEDIAYGGMNGYERSSQVHAGWVTNWPGGTAAEGGRKVGVDDDGTIRLVDLAVGTTRTGLPAGMDGMAAPGAGFNISRRPSCIYETTFRDRVTDMLRLVNEFSQAVSYGGGWLLGVHLNGLNGRVSQATQGQYGFAAPSTYDTDTYTCTTRATARQMADDPETLSATLLRRLYRGLGTEGLLS